MDELLASDIKLTYPPEYSLFLEIGDETEVSKLRVHKYLAKCPYFWSCVNWAIYHKNVSILLSDLSAEYLYAIGISADQKSKPLLYGLEDGVFFPVMRTMIMFHGDPLISRVNEIINRVVEAGLHNHWNSLDFNFGKILYQKESFIQPLDEYSIYKLYHMKTAFYLLLMGWCFSALCFIVEVLYNCVLHKIK
jgi:hypothetical protein